MRKVYLSILLGIILHSGFAQQGNTWYFGNKAALDFNQGAPTVLSNNVMRASEGSASIADNDGKLLFYSNGLQVFNRKHELMLNGDNLAGNSSSLQACVIVQVTGNDSMYYLFTTDAFENNFKIGYTYSIINLKRDNGYGEVISKNNILTTSCSERLTAARHGNGSDTWIITNDNSSNVFRSWLMTCNGLSSVPVTSTTGDILNDDVIMNIGMMKVSPDGKKFCQTNYPVLNEIGGQGNFVQLFDFDNLTGTISNPIKIASAGAYYYGCDFSPNSQLLYLLRSTTKMIDQYEIRLAPAAAILGSRIEIPAQLDLTGIQLAPDGRIYLSKTSEFLSIINAPDVKGTGCNYVSNQLSLSPGSSTLQLPAFMNDINIDPYNTFTYDIADTCDGLVQLNGFTNIIGSTQWRWDFGDGSPVSVLQNPLHQFTPSNRSYRVTLTISNALSCSRQFRITKTVEPRGVSSIIDFSITEKCDSGYVRFTNLVADADNMPGRFEWDFGDGETSTDIHPVHTYATAGDYKVQLKRLGTLSCLDDSVSKVFRYTVFSINISTGKTVLTGDPVQLFANSQEKAGYKWTPSTSLSNDTISSPIAIPLSDTYYKVTATNTKGCIVSDSVLIRVDPVNDIFIPTAFTPNGDGRNDQLIPFFPTTVMLKNFRIYNRWGQAVFSSTARGHGWDGKLNGIKQSPGAYVWYFIATDATGKQIERRGTLILSR